MQEGKEKSLGNASQNTRLHDKSPNMFTINSYDRLAVRVTRQYNTLANPISSATFGQEISQPCYLFFALKINNKWREASKEPNNTSL